VTIAFREKFGTAVLTALAKLGLVPKRELCMDVSIDTSTGCWNWLGSIAITGYPAIWPNGKQVLMHRMMYQIVNGIIDSEICVCHRCDNPKCVNPEHLFAGTRFDNAVDAAKKNRLKHKLTLPEVSEIRRLYLEGFTQTELATMFSVSQSHVSRMCARSRRQHVK
jgi:hypothetical protein